MSPITGCIRSSPLVASSYISHMVIPKVSHMDQPMGVGRGRPLVVHMGCTQVAHMGCTQGCAAGGRRWLTWAVHRWLLKPFAEGGLCVDIGGGLGMGYRAGIRVFRGVVPVEDVANPLSITVLRFDPRMGAPAPSHRQPRRKPHRQPRRQPPLPPPLPNPMPAKGIHPRKPPV